MRFAAVTLCCAVLFNVPACRAEDGRSVQGARMRPPAVAGGFYPARPAALRKAVSEMLDAAEPAGVDGAVLAAMAPHAGYIFSGQVAAYVFKAISETPFDTLVIIGHDAYGDAVAYLSGADAFRTPLGDVEVDVEMVKKLIAFHRGIRVDNPMHLRDHTVEVQLPFLQAMDRRFRIVPVMFGNPSPENCRIFADAIASAAGNRKVFVLASCDMSHYPPYEQAKALDATTLKAVESMDIDELFAHLADAERRATPGLQTALCAKGGVGTALLFARDRGGDRVQVLKYANSGDAPVGDRRRVVGYGAAVMLRGGE